MAPSFFHSRIISFVILDVVVSLFYTEINKAEVLWKKAEA
jgi:hypothetical protein